MSAPKLADALRTIARELPSALELLASQLEARAAVPTAPAAIEMVSIATFAREHSLHVATARQMAKEGRVEATKIGKRQWRVRRDSPIGQPHGPRGDQHGFADRAGTSARGEIEMMRAPRGDT